jgi:CheY-like chemotaxis protein
MGEPAAILVVDDDPVVRRLTIEVLTDRGYKVATGADGVEAFELMQHQNFAVVISDIQMPRMDGLTLLRRVKQEYTDLRVLLMTARSTDVTKEESAKLGADGFLAKPFKPSELLSALDQIGTDPR